MGISIAVDQTSAGVKAMRAAAPRPWPSNTRFKTKLEDEKAFDAQAFLDSAGAGRKVVEYESKETIFSQGDRATSVLYIQKGSVKLTVVNEAGEEAVVEILGPGEFFGVKCLADQPQRMRTAATITPSTILVIAKREMIRLLHAQRDLSDQFIKRVLGRNTRTEEKLVDLLFNSTEKRLARTLVLLARYGEQGRPERTVPGF